MEILLACRVMENFQEDKTAASGLDDGFGIIEEIPACHRQRIYRTTTSCTGSLEVAGSAEIIGIISVLVSHGFAK